MKFGIFYEHQLPRPWTEDAEYELIQNSLDQIELADRLGFDYAWEVEHHFMEEYSHSSAPEVFLGAASQRTKNIRLGHGIVSIMPAGSDPPRPSRGPPPSAPRPSGSATSSSTSCRRSPTPRAWPSASPRST